MSDDSELAAMQAVVSALEGLDPGQQRRVVAWVASRLHVNAGPRLPAKPFEAVPVRRGPSDEQLLEALAVYRSAERAPTQAVAKHYSIAHRTASLWIRRAHALEQDA